MYANIELSIEQINKLFDLAALTPIKKDRVLFIGRAAGRLIDNVKYAFLEACRNNYGFSPLFLTSFEDEYKLLQGANLPVVMFPQGIKEVAAAGVVVSDDFWWKSNPTYPLLHRSKTLQLWHGIPLKSIGFCEADSPVNMSKDKADYLRFQYSGYDAVLSTSEYVSQDIFSRVFDCKEFLNAGYPRNDILLRKPDNLDLLNSDPELYGKVRAHKRAGGKVAFYMPTFRDTGGDIFSDGAVDAKRLNKFCKEHNVLLLFKFHPFQQVGVSSNLTNFIVVPSHLDVYPLLGQVDFLITDYSSVYFDFLLVNRPIHFYVYDIEKYTSEDREFMLDFDTVTPGLKSHNQEDFFASLEQLFDKGDDGCEEERLALRAKLFEHNDAFSGKRVCEYIRDNLVA